MGKHGVKTRALKYIGCSLFNLVGCRMVSRKPHDSLRLIATTSFGMFIGFVVGVYVSLLSVSEVYNSVRIYIYLFQQSFMYVNCYEFIANPSE